MDDKPNKKRKAKVTDIEAARKWAKVPPHFQKALIDNVFCRTCGLTTIVDYNLQNNEFGVLLKGKCKKCGNDVARLVESE